MAAVIGVSAQQASPGWRDPLNGVLFVALLAAAVTQLASLPWMASMGLSPLVIGIVCGAIYGNVFQGTMPAGWSVGVNFTARRVLRVAVAFYGLRLSIQEIMAIGVPGMAMSVLVVGSTLGLGIWVGTRVLKLDRDIAILTSAGSAICGAAAVLAFESTLRSRPHQSAVAVATVVFFGTISMFLYPILARTGVLGLDTNGLGLFVGGTIHEVAQVVAASSNIDPAVMHTATIVKMARVALLVPVLLILGMWLAHEARAAGARAGEPRPAGSMPIPWFALGFLALAGINSLHILPVSLVDTINRMDTFALTMAMTALGIQTRYGQIRAAGPRVMALGTLLYVWLVLGGYGLTVLVQRWG